MCQKTYVQPFHSGIYTIKNLKHAKFQRELVKEIMVEFLNEKQEIH